MKLVFIRLDHLGDILLCTPMLRAVAEEGHTIEFVLPKAYLQVFENSPFVKSAHAIEELCPGFPRRWWRLGRWIRQQSFDGVLIPNGRDPGVLLASVWSGTKVRLAMWGGVLGRVTGHRCLRSGLLKHPRHFAEVMMDMARALGVPPRQELRPQLFPSPAVVEDVEGRVTCRVSGRKLVGIHPGSQGNACNLASGEYAKLAARILERDDVVVVITGTANEARLVASWPSSILSHPRLWNCMGQLGLHELAVLVSRMAVYVVPSTGPLHVAAWAGIKTVSPFCATPGLSPVVWGNTSGNGVALMPPVSYCAKIRQRRHGHCDFSGTIDAEMLSSKVMDLLDRKSA